MEYRRHFRPPPPRPEQLQNIGIYGVDNEDDDAPPKPPRQNPFIHVEVHEHRDRPRPVATGSGRDERRMASSRRTQRHKDYELALNLQRQFDTEDQVLNLQLQFLEEDARQEELLKIVQEQEKGFDCGVCMDELPLSDVAMVEDCDHMLCRDCLRNYVVTQITERKFPIVCPLCVAGKEENGGRITENSIQILGIPEAQYAIFEEMQLVMYAVPVQCPGCRQTVNIDRQEYDDNSTLDCPLPACNYRWCKDCQRAIERNGPTHSCDGTNELGHLMVQQGWKRCPRCKTPIERTAGCNSMTCRVPGCNTVFCYGCGQTPCQCGR